LLLTSMVPSVNGECQNVKNKILLIYPKLGMSGALVQHLPLSVLYAAIDSIKSGFGIDLLDVRLCPDRWEDELRCLISDDTLLVGISVMTGAPIRNALEISHWIKRYYPNIPLVWGGPHATFNGSEIFDEPAVDYVISGYGSRALAELARHLSGHVNALPCTAIAGLSFRNKQSIEIIPPEDRFEIFDFRDIPYHLVEADLHHYGQLDSNERIFPLYSSMGCPYQCAFCSSPAQYRNMRQKYEYLSPVDVADHIEYVQSRYGASYIYFIDDDSFVNLVHVEGIIDEINRREIRIKLGFRGARINEIKLMSDAYLSKLAAAGTNIFHIGAESGSQRMLDLIRKNCTVEDIIEVNRKMARHPEITTAYNWLVGLPGETLDDLRQTRELIMRLIDENPAAIMFIPNKYRPLPGTELYELAVEYGYNRPLTLDGWVEIEAEGDYRPPWYGDGLVTMINMMQVASYFIDDKLFKVQTGNTIKFRLARVCARLYAPFARFRYRHGISAFLFEYWLFNRLSSLYRA
jgi:anaerobic magnesium-protoporphyrin IX monomethyl ester cyclase